MKPIRMWRQRIRVGQNVFNGYCFSNTARTLTCLPSGFVPFALAVITLPSFEIDTRVILTTFAPFLEVTEEVTVGISFAFQEEELANRVAEATVRAIELSSLASRG
jgi:hypothetical protein